MGEDAKENIFQAASRLVAEGKDEGQITTRAIAAVAGVNSALVNYYFQSKENLLSCVVATMMGDIIKRFSKPDDKKADMVWRLKNMLTGTAEAAFRHRNICKIAISQELKAGCRNSCIMVMPFLRGILPSREDGDLVIIALQLMLPFHYIVLYPELYGDYLGTDFFDRDRREATIGRMVDCLLPGKGDA